MRVLPVEAFWRFANPGVGVVTTGSSSKRKSRRALSNAASNFAFLDSRDARARLENSPTVIAILSVLVGANEAPTDQPAGASLSENSFGLSSDAINDSYAGLVPASWARPLLICSGSAS